MNRENTERLLTRFRWLYREFYLPMDRTCMCWGFECGDGWFELLWNLSTEIEDRLNISWWKRRWPSLADKIYNMLSRIAFKTKLSFLQKLAYKFALPIAVRQVKEKFGTLSYYTDWCLDEIDDIIERAEEMSGETCETCGLPGKVLGRGWIYTACRTHTKEVDLDMWN